MIKSDIKPPFTWATSPKQEGQENEDSHLCVKSKSASIAGVMDGIGGAPEGEKASTQSAKLLFHALNVMNYRRSPEEIAEHLQKCLQGADHHLKQLAAIGRLHRDAGTCAVLAAVFQSPTCESLVRDVAVAWAGDCRCMAYMPDNTLRSLTIDNVSGVRLVGWNMIKSRIVTTHQPILSSVTRSEELDTQEKRRAFLNRNVVDSILTATAECPAPQYATSVVRVPVGTRLILCSDGLVDNLTDVDIQTILQKTPFEKAASILVEQAIERSHSDHFRAKPDDITVVQVSIENAARAANVTLF